MNTKSALLPNSSCLICQKTIQEIGGQRITSQKLRGIGLSNKYLGGGNPDYPHQSIKLYDDNSKTYVVAWGEKEKFTGSVLNRVRESFQNGAHPWFCQRCGVRTCSVCDAPINSPVGSDVISENGCQSHIPIFANTGCTNPECEKYKL